MSAGAAPPQAGGLRGSRAGGDRRGGPLNRPKTAVPGNAFPERGKSKQGYGVPRQEWIILGKGGRSGGKGGCIPGRRETGIYP